MECLQIRYPYSVHLKFNHSLSDNATLAKIIIDSIDMQQKTTSLTVIQLCNLSILGVRVLLPSLPDTCSYNVTAGQTNYSSWSSILQ